MDFTGAIFHFRGPNMGKEKIRSLCSSHSKTFYMLKVKANNVKFRALNSAPL